MAKPTRSPDPLTGRHVAFVVNVDWFFASHRLPIAHGLLNAGAEVTLMASVTDQGSALESHGIRLIDTPFSRRGRSLLELSRVFGRLRSTIRDLTPDLVHNVTVKPILTGSAAAASISRDLPVVNAISGFGHLLSDPEAGRIAPALTRVAYAGALRASRHTAVVVQNAAARDRVLGWGLARPDDVTLIPGMGVDPDQFAPAPRQRTEPPLVMLASRLIANKGLYEFVRAVDALANRSIDAEFVLVGPTDPGNPLSLTEPEVKNLCRDHGIQWWGPSSDMAATLRRADLFVLPTHHEGLPKVLLEAAATGLPIVTTDIPGCRAVVRHEIEALLVPPRTVDPLVEAMERLLTDQQYAAELGAQARERVLEHFTVDLAVDAHLNLYRELIT